MKKDDYIGIAIILGIIAITLSGGAKNAARANTPQTPEQKQAAIEKQVVDAQQQVEDLKKQVQAAEDAKTYSKYKGIIHLQYVSRSNDPTQEYISLSYNQNSTTSVPITGWRITSLNNGSSITIPKGTYFYYSNSINTEDNIVLSYPDLVYIITGKSPIGTNFKTNKCSGYLSQFQSFVPYITGNCPQPRYEDLSSIPKRSINDTCFDYIDSFPSCRIQTEPLPKNFSVECIDFIATKINYNSCINTHKGDKDFNTHSWYLYLGRTDKLWKDRRENIVLYDLDGKIVDSITY